jgi:hypothetical protein
MKGFFTFIIVIVLAAFFYHLYAANELTRAIERKASKLKTDNLDLSTRMNPFTNNLTVKLAFDFTSDTMWDTLAPKLTDGFIQGFGPKKVERELTKKAREKYDVYAMLIPYHVHVVAEKGILE